MTASTSNERLMKFLQATAEQQAAIDRILDGRVESARPTAAEAAVMAAPEPFITKAETARRMEKDLRTITTWMRKGLLPYYKIGRTVAFKWSEVEKHLAATCRVGFSCVQ